MTSFKLWGKKILEKNTSMLANLSHVSLPYLLLELNRACYSDPCLNSGTCAVAGIDDYTCLCVKPFEGKNCQGYEKTLLTVVGSRNVSLCCRLIMSERSFKRRYWWSLCKIKYSKIVCKLNSFRGLRLVFHACYSTIGNYATTTRISTDR